MDPGNRRKMSGCGLFVSCCGLPEEARYLPEIYRKMAAKNKVNPKTVTAKKVPASTLPAANRSRQTPPQLTDTFRPGFWQEQWMPALILVVLAFVLYGASLSFGYVLDDQMVIWENTYVQK